ELPPNGRLPRGKLRRRRAREHGRADARDADVPSHARGRPNPDHRLVEVRRQETLCLRAGPDVAGRARGWNGVGGAALLLAPLDRQTPVGIARRALVEPAAERGLHARELTAARRLLRTLSRRSGLQMLVPPA